MLPLVVEDEQQVDNFYSYLLCELDLFHEKVFSLDADFFLFDLVDNKMARVNRASNAFVHELLADAVGLVEHKPVEMVEEPSKENNSHHSNERLEHDSVAMNSSIHNEMFVSYIPHFSTNSV